MITSNLLLSESLAEHLKRTFSEAREITILSAYVTLPAVDFLFEHAPLGVGIDFVCRARPSDILNGSCDVKALKTLHYSGVRCFISRDLHAKLYVVDNAIGYLGSANFTSNGLKLAGYGNIELSIQVDLSDKDIALVNQIRNDAIELNNENLKELERYALEAADKMEVDEWWENIIGQKNYCESEGLYVNDLPWCSLNHTNNSQDSVAHDEDVFKRGNLHRVKSSFMNSKIYQFLLQKLEQEELNEAYFGTVTEWVHSALKDDILPYRSEIKDYVANLYTYIEQHGKEHFVVDQPNYSQRITLVNHD